MVVGGCHGCGIDMGTSIPWLVVVGVYLADDHGFGSVAQDVNKEKFLK